MIRIRTQYSPSRDALEVFVTRFDRVGRYDEEIEVLQRVTEGEDDWYDWVVTTLGEAFSPTFILPYDQAHQLVEDLNRDGMGVDRGAEGTVVQHKDDLKEILETVLPHALRGRA